MTAGGSYMTATTINDFNAVVSLVQDLYGFMSKIQRPRPADKGWSEKMAQKCGELADYAANARQGLADTHKALGTHVDEVIQTLKDYSDELSEGKNTRRLKDMYVSLSRHYEVLLNHLNYLKRRSPSDSDGLFHLKQANYNRNIFHASTGLLAVLLYEFVLTQGQSMIILLSILSVFTGLEISRRFSGRWNDLLVDKVFGVIARPHERFRINGATYYLAAITLMTALAPKTAVETGLLILAFGDPAALLAGKRWGKTKLWREKTLVGTSAFFFVSLIVCLAFFALVRPEMALLQIMALIVIVSAAGAVTELFSQRINDNFTIPVVCAGLASFWF